MSRRDDPTFDEALPGCHLVSSCANINDRQLQMLLTIIDTFKGRMSRDFYPRPPQFFAQLTPLGTDWHVNKGIFPIWFRFRRNNRIESSIFLFCGFKQTAKSVSAVYQWPCGVWLSGVNDIVGIFNMLKNIRKFETICKNTSSYDYGARPRWVRIKKTRG